MTLAQAERLVLCLIAAIYAGQILANLTFNELNTFLGLLWLLLAILILVRLFQRSPANG